jgi:quinol monooxygenase YgiN
LPSSLMGFGKVVRLKGDIMNARTIKVQIDVSRFEEAVKIYGESVAPAVKKEQGGVGALLLADRDSGKAVSITVWQDEDRLKAAQESGFMQEQIAKFTQILIGTPEIESFEIVVKDL